LLKRNPIMLTSCTISCCIATRSHCLIYLLTSIMRMMFRVYGPWRYMVSRLRARYACITKYRADHVGRPLIAFDRSDLQGCMIGCMIDPGHKESLSIRHHRSVISPFGYFREWDLKSICHSLTLGRGWAAARRIMGIMAEINLSPEKKRSDGERSSPSRKPNT
jgi:hypothetical protein